MGSGGEQVKQMVGFNKYFRESWVMRVALKTKKIGEDDPRRIIHSIKVALALTFVSMFYYSRPLYQGFGSSGIWAVLTVVVIFEFSVGATLSKGINRGIATTFGGGLGIGAKYVASSFGHKEEEAILLAVLLFILAAASTFTRFFPEIKKKYDYGVLIFILTFSLVAVSGYRVDKIVELAHQRLSTIIIGGATCIIISIFICPVWAGQDLHNQLALNLYNLALFLPGFGSDYFRCEEDSDGDECKGGDKSSLQRYRSILNSKHNEESLANFAWWEPGHGGFMFRHPWNQYLKIGGLARQCAYQFDLLNSYLITSPLQEPITEFQRRIKKPCMKICSESCKALKDLSLSIKSMMHPSAANIHIQNSKIAIEELQSVIQLYSFHKEDFSKIVPPITVASTLICVVKCVEEIADSIYQLSEKAHFKTSEKPHLLHRGIVNPINNDNNNDDDEYNTIIQVNESSSLDSLKNDHKHSITPNGSGGGESTIITIHHEESSFTNTIKEEISEESTVTPSKTTYVQAG